MLLNDIVLSLFGLLYHYYWFWNGSNNDMDAILNYCYYVLITLSRLMMVMVMMMMLMIIIIRRRTGASISTIVNNRSWLLWVSLASGETPRMLAAAQDSLRISWQKKSSQKLPRVRSLCLSRICLTRTCSFQKNWTPGYTTIPRFWREIIIYQGFKHRILFSSCMFISSRYAYIPFECLFWYTILTGHLGRGATWDHHSTS